MMVSKNGCLAAVTLLACSYSMATNAADVNVSEDLTIDIPVLLYMGNQYSAKLNYNGSCWDATEVTPIVNSTSSKTVFRRGDSADSKQQ